MFDLKEIRNPDFPGLRVIPDELGGAKITRNCALARAGQLDSRGGMRHANHIRYRNGVYAIIDAQRICDYGKILVCDGLGVQDHEEPVDGGWGGPKGGGGGGSGGGSGGFWDPGFPPVAMFTATPDSGIAPLLVTFDSTGSHDPDGGALSYFWDFGDGSPIDNQANPQHNYASGGMFTVTLTVVDAEGKTATASLDLVVGYVIYISGDLPGALTAYFYGYNPQTTAFDQLDGPVLNADSSFFWASANHFCAYRRNAPAPQGGPWADTVWPAGIAATVGSGLKLHSRNNVFYAIACDSTWPAGSTVFLWRALDGVNFARWGAPIPFGASTEADALLVLQNGTFLVSGANGVGVTCARYSTDNAATWHDSAGFPASWGAQAMSESPAGTVFLRQAILNNFRWYRSVDSGATFVNVYDSAVMGAPVGNYSFATNEDLFILAVDDLVQLSDYYDNGMNRHGIMRTTDGGVTWTTVYLDPNGDPGGLIMAPDGSIYASYHWGGGYRLMRSTDNGASWQEFYSDTAGVLNDGLAIVGGRR